jgi:hypothetical protein
MSLRSAREIAAIHELADKWLVITGYSEEKAANPWDNPWNNGPYSFTADVKPGEEPPDSKPWLIRQGLLRHAEEALDALAAAGWQFTECPRLEFSGRIQGTGSHGDWSTFQHGLSLILRFQVNRPRMEDAMHPAVIADSIMDGL